jgi:hypothetical protein
LLINSQPHPFLSRETPQLFHDETEAHHFQVYCESAATKISGYWETGIWSRLIVEACHQDLFTRHAIVSIGALNLAMEFQALRSKTSTSDKANSQTIRIINLPYSNMASSQAYERFAIGG